MRDFVRRLAAVSGAALAPLAFAVASPGISSAQPPNCGNGWWDPVANVCRPPVATQPMLCENGWWWDPVANVCRPPAVPPPPNCGNGQWWDPVATVCRPVLPPA
jgi:hypothetical protein